MLSSTDLVFSNVLAFSIITIEINGQENGINVEDQHCLLSFG